MNHPTPDLVQAFSETHYTVQSEPPFTLRIGQPCPELMPLMAQHGSACAAFITAWNEYLYALTLGGRSVKPITVAIQTLIGEYQVEWGLLTAGGIVGAMPATLLFLFIQKRLIAGMTAGAVKG